MTALWRHVLGGRAAIAAIVGDAGIGKTRLAGEFAATAAAGGARVLWGDCVDLHEGVVTHAPFRQALRAVEDDPGLRATLDGLSIPLHGLLDGRPSADDRGERPGALFEALLGVFRSLANPRPLLLVIEDIHWADHTTLDVLTYLTHNLGAVRMLTLLTVRLQLAERNPAAMQFLTGQASGAIASRVHLDKLADHEIAQLIAELTADEPRAAVVTDVIRRAGGNPLFVKELTSAHALGEGQLSPSLRQLLRGRVREFPDDVRDLLNVAAVAGQIVAHDELRAVVDLPRGVLGPLLRQAVEAGVLVDDPDSGRYMFRHAVMQEALEEDLPQDRRRELHRRFADVLVTRGRTTTASPGAVAMHWDKAGDATRALPAYLAAADAARENFGFVDAYNFLLKAYELWNVVDRPGALTGLTRREVANMLVEQASIIGEAAAVIDIARDALAQAERTADIRVRAFQRTQLAHALWHGGEEDHAVDEARRAAETLGADKPSPEQAWIFALQSALLALNGRFTVAGALAERALDVARLTGHPRAYRYALLTVGSVAARLGDLQGGLDLIDQADDLARRRNDADEIMRIVLHRGRVLQVYARWEDARRVYADGLAAAPKYGMSRHYAWRFHILAARMSFFLGQWQQAADEIELARSLVSGRNAALPSLMVATGQFDAAEAFYASPRARWRSEGTGRVQVPDGPVELAVWRGRLDDARAASDAGLELVDGSEELMPEARLCCAALRAEAEAVEREEITRTDAQARAVPLVDRLRALHAAHPPNAEGYGQELQALLTVGQAEWMRIVDRPDPDAWEHVATQWDALAMPYPFAYARWQHARTLQARGLGRSRIADLGGEALATADRLGAHPLRDAIVGRRRYVTRPEAPGVLSRLTPKERDVANLLVRGYTNRQIGSELSITEGTASVHVSRILQKLGVGSRIQAAILLREVWPS